MCYLLRWRCSNVFLRRRRITRTVILVWYSGQLVRLLSHYRRPVPECDWSRTEMGVKGRPKVLSLIHSQHIISNGWHLPLLPNYPACISIVLILPTSASKLRANVPAVCCSDSICSFSSWGEDVSELYGLCPPSMFRWLSHTERMTSLSAVLHNKESGCFWRMCLLMVLSFRVASELPHTMQIIPCRWGSKSIRYSLRQYSW